MCLPGLSGYRVARASMGRDTARTGDAARRLPLLSLEGGGGTLAGEPVGGLLHPRQTLRSRGS